MVAIGIDEFPLDLDITSREGISIDQMTRVRLAFLTGQTNALVAQTQFADAKAGALLAIIGLIATRGPGAAFDPDLVTAEGLVVIGMHAAALICCIFVLIPRYADRKMRRELAVRERFSWPALTSDIHGEDGFADFMRGAQVSQLIVSMARSNQAQAGILLRKFAWLRAAFIIAIIDFIYIAIRAALGAF